jgi:hypothetical protein
VSSRSNYLDDYIIIRIPFSTYGGNQNVHIEDTVRLIRLLCHKLASTSLGSRISIKLCIYFQVTYLNMLTVSRLYSVNGRIINECGAVGGMITGNGN